MRASAVGRITHSVPISSVPGSRANPGTRGSCVRLPETISTYRINVSLLCFRRHREAKKQKKKIKSREK
jgi:hypothetical protein